MKKQRGHTISVMTPAEANRQHEEAGFRAGAGGKDAVGQVTPAQVFLQLYHTHPLIMESQDLPLHVPSNEVWCIGVQRGLHYPVCVCVCANMHALTCVCKDACIILCVQRGVLCPMCVKGHAFFYVCRDFNSHALYYMRKEA